MSDFKFDGFLGKGSKMRFVGRLKVRVIDEMTISVTE